MSKWIVLAYVFTGIFALSVVGCAGDDQDDEGLSRIPRDAVVEPYDSPDAQESSAALKATMPTAVVGHSFIQSTDPAWNGLEGGLAFWYTQDPTGSSARYLASRKESFVSRSVGIMKTCKALGVVADCKHDFSGRREVYQCPNVVYTKPVGYHLNNGGTTYWNFSEYFWVSGSVKTYATYMTVGRWNDGSTALWCWFKGTTITVSRR